MPHPDLARYKDGFFETFLADLPNKPSLDQIQATVLMGDYVEYSGPTITPIPGASITPQFAISTGDGGSPQTFVMLWVVERFDVATDTPETITRILADFHPPSESGATESGSLSSDLATTWSTALTGAGAREALAKNLSEITAAPPDFPTQDLDTLKTFLAYFGTYKADGSYYAKGTVAEGTFPAGVSPAYLAADTGNVAEVKLPRDLFYCYALVPEQLWNAGADAARQRQLVYRIEDRGEESTPRWKVALLHTVAAQAAGTAGPRFVFCYAGVGIGLPIAETARTTLASGAAAFIENLPAYLADLAKNLEDPLVPIVGKEDAPYVLMIGTVTAAFPATPLPEGVMEDGAGRVRMFRCPPQHAAALAERTDIENLEIAASVYPGMTQAMAEINLAARTFPAGVTAANSGKGVVIGIVDTGIDGGHPAFFGRLDDATKSRIHSVWNLWQSGGDSPSKRSGGKAPYKLMTFGREFIGNDEVITSLDQVGGHGTHVAGIAAGLGFGPWPGGIAPGATLVVAGIGTNAFVNDILLGVKYCFQKADELGLPCVVNISMGTDRHAHDGTDALSLGVSQLVSVNELPTTDLGPFINADSEFVEGKVICCCAGNTRTQPNHWQAVIPAGGDVQVVYQPFGLGVSSANKDDGITFWSYNDDATTVRLRVSARHSFNPVLATPEVALMASNRPVATSLAGGLTVNIHNGPQRPHNRHFCQEIYWLRPQPATAMATAMWIIRLRNDGRSPCTVHGFASFREIRGGFLFGAAQTQPSIGVTYTPAELAQFESHKVWTPATAPGTISVAAYTSRPGRTTAVDALAWFSSPGPMRAVGPGQRAIDVAMPGDTISSAKAWTSASPTRGVVDMDGTSMASPMMAGAIAYLLQLNRKLTTGQIRTRLEMAASRRPGDSVEDWGLGRVDVSLLQP